MNYDLWTGNGSKQLNTARGDVQKLLIIRSLTYKERMLQLEGAS